MKKTLICIFALCAFLVSCTFVPSTTEQEADAVKTETSNAIEPADTFSFSAGASTIAVGTNHSLAIKDDGSLWAWGSNYYGQLGDGTTESRYTPIKILEGVMQEQQASSSAPQILMPNDPARITDIDLANVEIPPGCESFLSVINAYAVLEANEYTFNEIVFILD